MRARRLCVWAHARQTQTHSYIHADHARTHTHSRTHAHTKHTKHTHTQHTHAHTHITNTHTQHTRTHAHTTRAGSTSKKTAMDVAGVSPHIFHALVPPWSKYTGQNTGQSNWSKQLVKAIGQSNWSKQLVKATGQIRSEGQPAHLPRARAALPPTANRSKYWSKYWSKIRAREGRRADGRGRRDARVKTRQSRSIVVKKRAQYRSKNWSNAGGIPI